MLRLTPAIQNYAWGSHEQLARLTGRPYPTDQPEAELWMGAHEAAPCQVEVDGGLTTLDRAINADPQRLLGDEVIAAFGPRLPFLLKILAPEKALSIQVHPDAARAQAAPDGIYVDRWPKPEALCAVTEFEVFAGLRTFDEIEQAIDVLGVSALRRLADDAATDDRPVRCLLERVLHVPADSRQQLIDQVVDGCRAHPEVPEFEAIARVSHQFPDDIGLVVLVLMNHLVLQRGHYAFVAAGVLHAYVRGVAVEVLANSDNIVRAGLTPKAINLEELLEIVDPAAVMVPEEPNKHGRVSTYPADVPHFQLHRIAHGEELIELAVTGPRIVLSLVGSTTLECDGHSLVLAAGESCFLGAAEGALRVQGDGVVYVATAG